MKKNVDKSKLNTAACKCMAAAFLVVLISSCAHQYQKKDPDSNPNGNVGVRPDLSIDRTDLPENMIGAIKVIQEFIGAKDVAVLRANATDEETGDPFKFTTIDRELIVQHEGPINIEKFKEITKWETTEELKVSGSGCLYERHSGGDIYYYPLGCND